MPYPQVPDELMQNAGDWWTLSQMDPLLQHAAQIAQAYRMTNMPPMMRGRQMDYTPSPLSFLGATLNQILGGQRQNELMQTMARNLRGMGGMIAPQLRWQMGQGAPTAPGPAPYSGQGLMSYGNT